MPSYKQTNDFQLRETMETKLTECIKLNDHYRLIKSPPNPNHIWLKYSLI